MNNSVQTTFNDDTLDLLIADGTIENIEGVFNNGNENK